jgi:hypothetical protein
MLATLGVFAAIVPAASADSALPVWTCRASAGYVEVEPLLDEQRVEPVIANGFPFRDVPEADQCASTSTGGQDVDVPETGPALLSADAAFASTTIEPQIGAARTQSVTADGGVADATVTIGALVITATGITAHAEGSCNQTTTPSFSGSSTVVTLKIGDQVITLPGDNEPFELELPLLALKVRVALNQQLTDGTATSPTQSLTQRAVQIEVTSLPGDAAIANVVLGEAIADRNGAVCAAPVAPVCPSGSVLQPGSDPAVCVLTVVQCGAGSALSNGTCVQQCPTGSTADPNAGGACVIVRQVAPPCPTGTSTATNGACIAAPAPCPAGTVRDPAATNNCILVRERPCPAGSTPDPATRVCVLPVVKTTASSGENGRVGSSDGPRATCGRLEMHFMRGLRPAGRAITSRYGTRTVTRGRLVTCGSNPRPIVGARVDVVHVLPGDKRRRKTGLRSRANGLLTLILPIDLRTRRIEYAYRPDLNSTRVTSRVLLSLTVRNRAGRVVR